MAELLNSDIKWDNSNPIADVDIQWDESAKRPSVQNFNKNAAVDAMTYSQMLGVDPETIVNDYDNFSVAKKEHEDAGVVDRLKQSWDIGVKNTRLGMLGWRSMLGENLDNEISQLRQSIPKELPDEYGIVEKAFRSAAKLAPTSIEVLGRSVDQGLKAGMGGAAIAALAGQAGPQAVIPEEIITVPGAFAAMYAVGAGPAAFEAAMQIEGGHAYLEMLDMEDAQGNKIDPTLARAAAAGVGIINGALEFAQIKLLLKTIPGADKIIGGAINKTVKDAITNKTIQSVAKKAIGKYGRFLTLETGQEVAQESTNIIAGELAKNLNNALKDTDIEPATREEIINRLVETAKESALAFSVLGLPGTTIQTTQEVNRLLAERSTKQEVQDAANNIAPGHDLKFERHADGEGFIFSVADEDSPIQGQSFTTESLNPVEINSKIKELKEQTAKLDPEAGEDIKIQAQEDIEQILQEPDVAQDVIDLRDEELNDAEQLYETNKDIWIGNKDVRILETEVENSQIQTELKTQLGQKRYTSQVKDIDIAIQLYIDSKNDPEYVEENIENMPEKWQKLYGLAQNIPPQVMPQVDRIEKSYADVGVEALDEDVIKNIEDNYASRVWDLGEKPSDQKARKFGTKTRHAKQRKYKTIAEGIVGGGLSPKIESASNNLKIYKEEVIKVIEDKKFLKALKTLKDAEGDNIFSRQQYSGYEQIEHPNFTDWRFSEKVDLDLSDITDPTGLKIGDFVKALDRDNIGKIVDINESQVTVHFINKQKGTESTVVFNKTGEPEIIVAAVVKDTEGNIYEGQTHHLALEKLDEAGGEYQKGSGDLFITSKKRLIERDEAVALTGDETEDATGLLSRDIGSRSQIEGLKKVGFGQNYFIAEDGSVFERTRYYAPKKIAKNMNNILGTSSLYNVPGVRTLTKYNAIFKQWILLTSFFHHLAFMRSYWLGTNNKKMGDVPPRQAYKDGLKAIDNLEPEIMRGVRNGLTIGLRQEWEEYLIQEKTVIGKIIDRVPGGETVKDKILELKERQADYLFGTMGAGLKAKSYLIEYRKHLEKNPTIDSDVLSKQVASLINDDFGGLHLQRLGRNPTLQHIFRLFTLAPDWTESNIRTMVKIFANSAKDAKSKKAEKELYRKFWFGILWKGAATTALLNFVLAGGDPEKMEKNFKKAWSSGSLRWLELDITPIYRMLGGAGRDRRYFSVWGHFRDPLKFVVHPIKSAHHKGSVVYGLAHEALAGTDWAGRKFTTLDELMNTGKTVGWGRGGPIDWDQFTSYALSQVIGTQPIQVQNFAAWMSGEMHAFDAISNSAGLGVRRTYEPELKP